MTESVPLWYSHRPLGDLTCTVTRSQVTVLPTGFCSGMLTVQEASVLTTKHVTPPRPVTLLPLCVFWLCCFLFFWACRCLVPKGTSQITMKGRQWRHAVVYWPFLVAGLVDASAGAATLPTAEQWVRHERKNNKRNRDKEGSDGGGSDYGAAPGGGCASDGDEMASADAAEDTSIQEEDLDALFDNEEDGDDDEVVPIDQRTYKDLFDDMPVRDAVQEVVCRAALLMGKLCGDNQADDADMSEVEARELAREAYEFVTKFMVALFGPMHTSKAHRLAYHLFDELILRGNLVDADTSVNELLHKLVKIMYRRTNKQDQAFTLQLMRAEQTLAFAVDEDADREVLRKAGLLGADGVLLDPSRNGQAELERAAMDGHVKSAARRLRKACGASDAEKADDEGALNAHGQQAGGRRPARRGAARRARTAATAARLYRATIPSPALMRASPEDGNVPDLPARDRAHSARLSDRGIRGDAARRGAEMASSALAGTRVRGVNVTVADVIAEGGPHLDSLRSLLQLRRSTKLMVTNQFPFMAKFEWGSKGRKQHVLAATMYYNGAWYDHVLYSVSGSKKVHHVHAVLLVKAIDGSQCDLVIVQKLVPAEEREGYVLSGLESQRLRWSMDRRASHPRLEAVHIDDLLRLVHVVPDFEDLCDRHGMLMAPTDTPKTRRERVLERFFVNRFYPWTSNGLGVENKA